MRSVSGESAGVKHALPSRSAKYFRILNALGGTIFAEADTRQAGRKGAGS